MSRPCSRTRRLHLAGGALGDICRKRERLLALSRSLPDNAFEISNDWSAFLVPDASTAVDRDAVGPVEKDIR